MAPGPALRPGVAVIPMDGGVQLRVGDEEVHVLHTEAPRRVCELLARLDGQRDREALLGGLGREDAHLLSDLLDRLGEAGLLTAARVGALDEVGRYLCNAAPDAEDPAAALRGARVAVTGHGAGAALMARVLGEHGIEAEACAEVGAAIGRVRGGEGGAAPAGAAPAGAAPAGAAPAGAAPAGAAQAGAAPAGALVCLWEAPDLALSLAVNRAACEARVPCLFVDLSHGRHATVGPFFVPGEGACHACQRRRLHENTAAFAELRAAEEHMVSTGGPLPSAGVLPAHRHVVVGLAAAEVVAFFVRHRPLRTLNRAVTVALEQAETWSEPVWRVPWCEACR